MSTAPSTADYLLDQTSAAGDMRVRKMFGEYALYCDDKVVALICDDQLYVKPTDAGRAILGTVTEAPPYPSAKPFFRIDAEKWDDRDWLSGLIAATAQALPEAKKPRPKVPKR